MEKVATPSKSGHPAKMTARAQRKMLNEVKKNPSQLKTYRNLWNMLTSLLTSLRYVNKNGVHGRTPRKKPLLSKQNIAAGLKFAKVHLDVPLAKYYLNR